MRPSLAPFAPAKSPPGRALHAVFAATLLALLAAAPTTLAQNGLGGAPDGSPTIPTRENFEQTVREAPWSAGSWRFQPWLGLRDAALVSNQVTETDSAALGSERDFTLAVGAGLRAYYPQRKLVFTAQVLPEYVWWQDSEDKRRLNGRYGVALFGFFNRLRFELSSRLVEEQGFFSREVQQLTSTSRLQSRAHFELDLARGISTYAYATSTTIEGNKDDFDVFTSLDRDEEAVGLGLRLQSARGFSARVAVEQSTIRFADLARDLSSDGTEIEVALGLRRRRVDAHLSVRFDELEPTATSSLEPYDNVNGSLQVTYKPNERLDLAAYATRDYSYSVESEYSYISHELQGLRMLLRSRRGAIGLFAATGEDEYEVLLAPSNRLDDVTEMGAQVDFKVRRLLIVGFNVLRRDYDSNDDFYDRDVTSFGMTVQLGEIAERLRFGNDRGAW